MRSRGSVGVHSGCVRVSGVRVAAPSLTSNTITLRSSMSVA
ncbi:MAG: hypothetical protein R3B70_33335 [Polyangiaceae bacterium]